MQAFQGAHNASNPTLIVQLIRARCDLNFEHTSYRIDPDTKMVDEATRIRNVGLKAYLDYLQRLSKFVIDGVTTVGKPEYVTATAFANKVYIVSFPYVYKGTLVLCDPATVAEARSPDKVSPNNEEIPSTNDSTKTSANEDVDYTQLFLQESEILPIDEEEFCYDDDIELETCGISNENTSEPSMSFGGCAEDSPDERMAAEPVTRRENFLLMTFEEIADKAAIFFTADQKEVPSESKQDQSVLDSGNASTTCSSSSSSSSSSACSASPKEEHDAKAENKAVEVPTTQLEIKGDLKVYVLFSNHKIVKMEYMYQ